MTRDELLSAASMPVFSPSYPRGPYRFMRREYLVISYESDADLVRQAVPEPLIPIGNVVNKGITIRANQASVKRLLPRLIEHIKEGRLNPKEMITHRIPLDEVSEAYHMFSTKLDGCIKPVLVPAGA